MNYIATIRKFSNNVSYPNCDFDLKPIKPTKTFKTIESNCEEGPFETLKKIQIKNVNRVATGHININSIGNKFDMLTSMVKDDIDILMVLEIKLDSLFHKRSLELKDMPLHLDVIENLMMVAFSFL